ncbi:MAG TPA: FliG C-terminal domain-containing protein, partial [Steroidobacter sp.]|nr:FliG C-terminal domain-containing protein [Steroidobacter sp.]
ALKGCEPALREAILHAMPRRQAQAFTDMMRRLGPTPRSRVEQAREELMSVVKELAESREIELQLFEEAVVE